MYALETVPKQHSNVVCNGDKSINSVPLISFTVTSDRTQRTLGIFASSDSGVERVSVCPFSFSETATPDELDEIMAIFFPENEWGEVSIGPCESMFFSTTNTMMLKRKIG